MKKGLAVIVAFTLILSQFALYMPSFATTSITVGVSKEDGTSDVDVAIGEVSEYTVTFDLDSDLDTGDFIKVKFPSGTSFVNSTIDKTYVTVDGANPTVNPTTSGTIASIVSPADIASGSTVVVVFSIDAGVKNPTSQSGKYQLQVGTFEGPNGTTAIENYDEYSSYYYIGYRAIVTIQPNIDPNYSTTGVENIKEFVTWSIKWKTGNQGKLTAGSDTFTLDFTGNDHDFPKPEGCFDNGSGGYYIPATYIQIDNKVLKSSATATLAGVAPNQTLQTILFTIPNTLSDISANKEVTIILTNQVGMKNPVTDDYKIGVTTSRETINITSEVIAVNDAVSFYDLDPVPNGVQGVIIDPPTTSTVASFQMGIINDIPLSVGVGTITFAMPMTMSGVRNPPITAVIFEHSIDGGLNWIHTVLTIAPTFSSSIVVITVPLDIPANSPIRVTLTKNLNLKTPTTAGAYVVQAMTSAQPYYRSSPSFSIGTGVSGVKVIPSPSTDGSENVQYVVDFKLGQSGALYKDSGTITIQLDLGNNPITFDGTTISNGSVFFSTGKFTKTPTKVDLVVGNTFNLTVSPPEDLRAGSTVKITFKDSAGLINPIAGSYKGIVWTSSETLESESETYEIQDAIDVNTVVVDPTAAGEEAEYTINVTVDEALTKNIDTISIALPSGQRLPSTLSPGDISVDGTDVILTPTVRSSVVTFSVPNDIPAGTTFDIVLKKSGKIVNPTKAGVYKLQVNTSKQIAYRLSPPYNIGSSVTNIELTPMPDTADSENVQYEIKFKIGTNGALTANSTDKIFIELDLGALPAPSAASVTIDKKTCIVNPVVTDLTGGRYRFELSPPEDIRASGSVTVLFTASSGLKNPAEGNYRATVYTNKEPIEMQSPIYLIKNAVVINSVDVEPPATSEQAEYTVNITISKKLTKDIDTITIAFPRETRLERSINKGSISIENNGIVQDLTLPPTISSTTITFPVPATYDPNAPGADPVLIIVFKESAKVQNPTSAGVYTLQVKTSSQPYYRVSPNYAIGTSVKDFTITPSPRSKNSTDVQYTYKFKLGTDGGLAKNTDAVHILQKVIPGSPVPVLLPTSSVMVGNDYTQVATTIVASTDPNYPAIDGWVEISIYSPEDLRSSASVTLVILPSAGLINPDAGNYKGVIWTDQEPIQVESEFYQIEDTIAFNAPILVEPPSIGMQAEYTIELGLDLGLQANKGTITLAFPSGTKLERTIPTTGITIQIGAGTEVNINVTPVVSSTKITITVPVTIPDSSDITIRFKKNANVTNPTTSGLYKIQAMTSTQPFYAESDYYVIGSSITDLIVYPMPNNIGGERVVYLVNMKLGVNGLVANEDKIYVSLPLSSPAAGGSLQPSTITVNGEFTTLSTPYIVHPVYGAPYIQFEITTPIDIKSKSELEIIFLESCALTNPLTEGVKFAYAHTSQEDIDIKSELYNIVDSVSFPGINPPLDMRSVIVKSNGVSLNAQYIVHFVTSATKPPLTQNLDRISFVFPYGTKIPSSISSGSVYISTAPFWGVGDPDAVTCPPLVGIGLNQPVTIIGQEVSFPTPITIPAGSNVYVMFCKDANIENPQEAGIYSLLVKTSTQPNYGISRNYIIRTTVKPAEVIPMPPVINQFAEYTIQFKIGSDGALFANNDKIFIGFDGTQYLTPVANLAPASVKINGQYCNVFSVVNSGAILPPNVDNEPGWALYRWIEIQTPIAVEAGAEVTVEFLLSANISNPAIPNNYKLITWTSKEPIAIESMEFTIGDAVQNLTVPITHPNPKTTSSFAEYLVEFDLGLIPSAQLYANVSSISVEFPEGTSVPTYLNPADIKIGTGAICNPTFSAMPPINIDGNIVSFRVPINIPNGNHVCVKFEKGAQIVNPQEPGSYQLRLKTSSQPIFALSNYYSILSTSSIPKVTLEPAAINARNVAYEIKYITGINGGMSEDIGEIVVFFDPSYIGDYIVGFDPNPSQYPQMTTSIPPNSIFVNGIVLDSIPTVVNAGGDLKYIKIITPVGISSESEVIVSFTNVAGIKNPPTVGLYRLAVLTSVEPTPVESTAFSLFSSVGGITVELAKNGFVEPLFQPAPEPRGATPNAEVEYRINFATGPSGNLVKDIGTITIKYPVDTTLPQSILAGSIRLKVTDIFAIVTFDGTLAQAPVINHETNEVVITVPTDINAIDTVDLKFTELAGIRNPSQSGTYTLEVSTSSEPLLIRSDPYSILGLSSAIVLVNPCLQELTGAKYTVTFTNVNPLAIGDTIDIEFPYGTRLPSVIDGDNVLVNNHPANVGAFPQIAVDKQIVSIKVPQAVRALSTVRVEFLEKARVQNPSSGMYNLKIKSGVIEPDNRWVESNDYFICGDFNLTKVTMDPEALVLDKNQRKTITVTSTDEEGNIIPPAGLQYYWTVSGNAGSLSAIDKNEAIFTAAQIAGSGSINCSVTFGNTTLTVSAQVSVASGIGRIVLTPTVASLGIGESQAFKAEVWDENNNPIAATIEWFLEGTSTGTLNPKTGKNTTFTAQTVGTSKLRVIATYGIKILEATAVLTVSDGPGPDPSDKSPIQATITPQRVNVNQGDISFNMTFTSIADITNGLVEVTIPSGFPEPMTTPGGQGFITAIAGSGVSISNPPSIEGNRIIFNVMNMPNRRTFTLSYSKVSAPSTPGEYIFQVSGKKNPESSLAQVETPPKVLVVSAADGSGRATINPNQASAGATSQSFEITLTSDAELNGGAVQIIIPQGWSRPSSSSTAEGYVHVKTDSLEFGNTPEVLGNTITVPILNMGVNDRLTLIYENVRIPAQPNVYTFVVKTQGIGGNFVEIPASPSVKVSNTRISEGKVEVVPNQTSMPAEYIISFRTSGTGFLTKDKGTIEMLFPGATILPSSIQSSKIMVNGEPVHLPPDVEAVRSKLTITTPLDIPSNTLVIIKISVEADIVNPAKAADDYKIMLITSSDTIQTQTDPYEIIVSELRNIKVTVSPIQPAAIAEYKIELQVGGAGALNVNQDSVTIAFPSDTEIPSSIPANAVTINNVPLMTRPQIDLAQRKIIMALPVRIENDSEMIIEIKSQARVKNPTRDGMYKLTVFTSKETIKTESEAYQIGTSLLGDVKVSTSSSLVEADDVTYTIQFRTGGYGRIEVGETVTASFDSRYDIGTVQAHHVTINGVVCVVTPEVSEGVSVIIKSPIAIDSDSNVTVTISNIKNPKESGEYTISIATKAEPMPVVSTPYTIGMILHTEITINPSAPNGLASWYKLAPNILFNNDVATARVFYSWDDETFQRYMGLAITAPEGIHTLTYYSVAETFSDEPKQDMSFKVDTKAPEVHIMEPRDGAVVNEPQIKVEGEVYENNKFTVTVNGRPATITEKRFTSLVSLNPGDNLIDIVAIDDAGNRSITPRIRVKYVQPSDIKFNIASPQSLSSVLPVLVKTDKGNQLTATLQIQGKITPATSDIVSVIIIDRMEVPVTIDIDEDGAFSSTVKLPVIAGLNGVVFSVKDKITGKEYSTSVAIVAKVAIELQIGNSLAFINKQENVLDAPPYINDGRTMLPMRFVGEAIGASVGWIPQGKIVTYDFDTIHIELSIGSKEASIRRGEKEEKVSLEVAPEINSGRTFVPLRFVTEALGAEVEWVAETKTIIVTK